MKKSTEEDPEYGYTMESILRERGYPEDMIQRIAVRKAEFDEIEQEPPTS